MGILFPKFLSQFEARAIDLWERGKVSLQSPTPPIFQPNCIQAIARMRDSLSNLEFVTIESISRISGLTDEFRSPRFFPFAPHDKLNNGINGKYGAVDSNAQPTGRWQTLLQNG